MFRTRRVGLAAGVACLAMTVAACGGGGSTQAEAGSGKGTITVWAHDGQPGEDAAIKQAVQEFNDAHTGVTVSLTLIPEKTYSQTINSTPASKLPDVFEFDGPSLASDVFADKLSPLTDLVSPQTLANQSSSATAQNTYQYKQYGVSVIDSGLGMYGNKKMLDAAGVKYPTSWKDSWTADDFQAALVKLAAKAPGHKALDVQENTFPGEWASYGFLPIVNSTGHRVVANNSAQDLDNPTVIAALEKFASWRDYIDANTDAQAFPSGRVALSWVGHWMYPTYSKALGNDLVTLPLPSFGEAGAKTGMGSWAWGISTSSKNGKAAGKFLDYLTSDKIVSAYTTADGAPPATNSVLTTSPLYKDGGPLHLFAEALQTPCGASVPSTSCVAVPRPVTPAYPVISQQFQNVIEDALKGGNVPSLVHKAASAINLAYQQNNNYGQ
ncbi:MAG: extracellular solute-binding protein [Streptomycetaceae bacterium]|nr:extracellular solute-binding protein [Streptomycetaceae bacterium]